jgi:NAD(P)H dehydrogenase (quinone)
MSANVLVIRAESTPAMRAAASDALLGAREAGATVRMRPVAPPMPDTFNRYDPAGFGQLVAVVPEPVSLADLVWADGIAFGVDGFLGNVPAPLKEFLDSTVPLWADHQLEHKIVTAFSSSQEARSDTALLALFQTVYHWGSLVLSGAVRAGAPAPGGPPSPRELGSRIGELAARAMLPRTVPLL